MGKEFEGVKMKMVQRDSNVPLLGSYMSCVENFCVVKLTPLPIKLAYLFIIAQLLGVTLHII